MYSNEHLKNSATKALFRFMIRGLIKLCLSVLKETAFFNNLDLKLQPQICKFP